MARQSIIAWVNSILGTYCKGAAHKKGNKILVGNLEGVDPVGYCKHRNCLGAQKEKKLSFHKFKNYEFESSKRRTLYNIHV